MKIKNEQLICYIFIVIISLVVSIPLFNNTIDMFRDDGIQHIARLMGTFQSIAEGQNFPVIMSNFCNGFGYSWNLFYSPITAYIPLLFKIFSASFTTCIKLFMVIVTILSGIAMYNFILKVTKNKLTALLGAVIYILAPYRLTDMYIRNALAELTSFIFLPIVFNGLYTILNKEEKKGAILLILSASALILTHTVLAMYIAIFVIIYVLINIKKLKEKKVLLSLIISLIFTLCITSFFWAPLLEHKLATEYEVFKPGRMERTEVLIYYKLTPLDFIYTAKGNMCFEIGLITIIGLLLTPVAYKKIKKEHKKIYLYCIIVGIICLIMTLKIFPFEHLPSILKMLQFSFRLLEFSSFFLAFVVAINYSIVIKNFRLRDVLFLSFITVLLIIPLARNLTYKENYNEEVLWPAVSVNENTKRVHAGCASFEYLPSKAFENLDYIKTRNSGVHIISGNAKIEDEQKNGTQMSLKISDVEENTTLELPYIYYLGYTVNIKTNNEVLQLQTHESENGFIAISINKDMEGIIEIKYEGTATMKVSMIISVLSLICVVVGLTVYNRKLKKEN